MSESDWEQRFRELTHPQQAVLDEDLASLQKMSAEKRVEKYRVLEENEEEFVWELSKETDFTKSERDAVRSRFRLARLLLAASFYEESTLPDTVDGDFIEAELQAVVEFDRYKKFDTLSEDQIERKIRRMDGEVYELVTAYQSTQISNIDALLDNPDVQQDVMDQLVNRYEDRLQKVREGFYVYVETHGLTHMVERIEEAVKGVTDASEERDAVVSQFQEELTETYQTLEQEIRQQQTDVEQELRTIEHGLYHESESDDLQEAVERVQEQQADGAVSQQEALSEIEEHAAQTRAFGDRLSEKITELEELKTKTREEAQGDSKAEAVQLIDREIERIRERRNEIERVAEQLDREREQVEAVNDRIAERRREIQERVGDVSKSTESLDPEEIAEDAVTTAMARLLERDYISRFDTSIHEAGTIATPNGEISVSSEYWDGRSEHRDARTRLTGMLDDGADVAEYPVNSESRYEVSNAKLFGLRSDAGLVIEARVVADLDALVTNGFVARPAALDTLLSQVNDVIPVAEENEVHHLVGLASPTGWSENVVDRVGEERAAKVSRYVSVVLVDLGDGEVVYDESDRIADANSHLFELDVDSDRLAECATVVEQEYANDPLTESVLASEIVDSHGFDSQVVRDAFELLEQRGVGRITSLDELGQALDFGR